MICEDASFALQLLLHANDVARKLVNRGIGSEWQGSRDGFPYVDPGYCGAGQREQEILKPGASSKFAVGHNLQSHTFLKAHSLLHRFVFYVLQLGIAERTCDVAVLIALGCRTGLQQLFRPQQAPDVFCSKWWS